MKHRCEFHTERPNPNYPCYDCAQEELRFVERHRDALIKERNVARSTLQHLDSFLVDNCPELAAQIEEVRCKVCKGTGHPEGHTCVHCDGKGFKDIVEVEKGRMGIFEECKTCGYPGYQA